MAALTQATIGDDGWCREAARYDSPNFDSRPAGMAVELLVVHNISLPAGSFGGPHIADLFTNRVDFSADPSFADLRGLAVSAHFLVRRNGRVVQFVSCNDRAWHAGVSRFQGRERCNDFSVGIEMEGSDLVVFSPAQYESLAALTLALAARYPLIAVQGHEHVAPGRKTDPGPCFDWDLLAGRVQLAAKMAAELAETLHENAATLVPAHRLIRIMSTLNNVKAGTGKK